MIEQDTIKLLRECDAGIKMGTSSIEDVLKYVSSKELEKTLTVCTFRELSANQEYEFLITTGEGEYSIVYSYGLYRKK